MINKHKPECASNINCAVYHADGICPGYKKCDCGAEEIKKEVHTCDGVTCDCLSRKSREQDKALQTLLTNFHKDLTEYLNNRQ